MIGLTLPAFYSMKSGKAHLKDIIYFLFVIFFKGNFFSESSFEVDWSVNTSALFVICSHDRTSYYFPNEFCVRNPFRQSVVL